MVHGQGGVKFQNWAKTYGSSPELYFQPTSVEEIREILDVARQRDKRVKVVGGGHSPSDIACTDDFMIQMGKMNRVLKVDKEKQQVTVEGGIFLSDLNVELSKHGLALANLGAVSEVAAAGVIGTGTHNTGIKHGILPTQVVALTLLTASGEILECSESINADIFQAARLHLGCLGIVLTVTFQCVPQFHLHEVVFPSTLTEVLDHLDDHLKRSQYFRFLWFPHSENVSVIYQDPTNKAGPTGLHAGRRKARAQSWVLPRAGVLGWACSARAAGGGLYQANSILGLGWALPMLCGLCVPGHRRGWGCPSSQQPHDKAWSLPGNGCGPLSSWERDVGSPGVPFSKSPLPAWSWSRHVLPPSRPLQRKLQTLLVPNYHHLPLLGFAAPLFLCQLVLGLCCWLLFAGVSALDQYLHTQLGVLDQPLLLLAPLQFPGGEYRHQLQDLQL
ncbi:L-gulonolactone oxidase-like isoform X1 [Phalacrocorax aristotelis]|uniref:L-gulonolactone oxidase-like isoform X1 n=1 Tax=Phalacrocorax aristotelis TaxID=126867 RepID=UPI003F4B6A3E